MTNYIKILMIGGLIIQLFMSYYPSEQLKEYINNVCTNDSIDRKNMSDIIIDALNIDIIEFESKTKEIVENDNGQNEKDIDTNRCVDINKTNDEPIDKSSFTNKKTKRFNWSLEEDKLLHNAYVQSNNKLDYLGMYNSIIRKYPNFRRTVHSVQSRINILKKRFENYGDGK